MQGKVEAMRERQDEVCKKLSQLRVQKCSLISSEDHVNELLREISGRGALVGDPNAPPGKGDSRPQGPFKEMAHKELSVAKKALLQVEIADLKETVDCLHIENQDLLKENKSLKDKNKNLQGTADSLRTTVEEMQQKVENVQEKTDHTHRKISHLDLQNKSLAKANEELTEKLHEVLSQVDILEEYKAAQDRDLAEMQDLSVEVKKYLRSLGEKMEEMEQRYQEAQLREKVRELLPIGENQRKGMKDLRGQVEVSFQQAVVLRMEQKKNVQVCSLMHGIAESRLVNMTMNGMRKNITHWLWRLDKFLAPLAPHFGYGFGFGLLFSVFLYIINQQFISDIFLTLLGDEDIEQIVGVLSPYLTWKNDGLLHF
ncbi:UNVERIFIED_CONTAM: hypothetical protein K2H54_072223 [Gekko kuhli]